MNHPAESELHDWIDGLLPSTRAVEVETHVAACDVCAADVAVFRTLLAELTALPSAIEPARDLRPGIAAAIDAADPAAGAGDPAPRDPRLFQQEAPHSHGQANSASTLPRRKPAPGSWVDRPLRSMGMPLAAAALGLVALSSVFTARVLRDDGSPAAPAARANSLAAVEARYAAAIGELETLLRDRRAELPPEALRLLGESLAVVDAALAETRAALRTEPDNPALPTVLLAAYERKLELLRGAAALEAET